VLHRLEEVPAGPVWVHCAGGYRAGVVAALLDAHGVDVIAVDDSFDNAGPAGLSLTSTATKQEIPA
jgi:rhodanese-related sulfurtransferase